jgi:hypothetical protein
MKWRSALTLTSTACLAAAGLLSASALGLPIPLGSSLPLEVEGEISPSKLSKTIPEPISLTWHGKFSEPSQGTKSFKPLLSLQFDKYIAIFTKGLSTCTLSAAEVSEQSCLKSIVGHGKVEFDVNFPGQSPPILHEKGPVVIYNGAQLGGRGLIFHFFTNGRYPFEWWATGVFRKVTGKFGTQTSIEFPGIPYIYLTGLQMTIGKTWKYKGKKVGFLSAKCPKGALFIHSEYEIATGTMFSGEIANHCG